MIMLWHKVCKTSWFPFLLDRNTSIAKQLCSIFPNDSNASSAQIRVLKQPGQSSVLNHTEVVFSLILQTQSNSSRMVIKNSTLDYIVQKSVYYISKHLGGYKVIYVNSNPPSFEKFCNYTELPKDINEDEVAKGVSSKKGTIDSITAGTVTSGIVIVIIIACVFIWCKRYEIILNAFLCELASHFSFICSYYSVKFKIHIPRIWL